MGVAGLWDILKPAAQTRSLTDIAIKEGFEANPDGKRGFRIGIDASIWFFHAEYGREGENPVLRTLFFRCATLMRTTFLPLFVFDGPKRPDVKRGKKINRTSHKLIPGMKHIVEAFGFEWRMAPGEAEAELAYLNRIGVIDGILSDDVDNFLFGATTVIRNSSNTLSGNRANPVLNSAGKDDKNHTRVFRLEDITKNPQVRLTRGGMILIGLMSGGDYQQGGLSGCGTTTSHGLAKCGFGDRLYEAALSLDRQELSEFLVGWREEIRQELRTNSQKHLGRKQVALSNSIPEDFPDIDILLSYVNPITSESMGRESNNTKLTWTKEPDLAKLAAACEFYFEWGYKEAIIKRFRTIMWNSIVLRILRRAALEHDTSAQQTIVPSTPRKKGKTIVGTPSKMIAAHFSSLHLATPSKGYVSGSESESEDSEERLIIKIHSTRTHTSTDGLLEYRLEIAPKQLVRLTESGIKGTRMPEGPDEWASEADDDEEGGSKKKGKGQPIHPETHLRLWMPACMVKIVEPKLVQDYEDLVEKKNQKKSKKGGGSTEAKKDKPGRKTSKASKPIVEDDVFSSSPPKKPAAKARQTSSQKVSQVSQASPDDEDDMFSPNSPEVRKVKPVERKETPSASNSTYGAAVPSSSTQMKALLRTGVRDLTKKKKHQQPSSSTAFQDSDLKAFFPVGKTGASTTSKQDAPASLQTKPLNGKSRLMESTDEISHGQPKGLTSESAVSKRATITTFKAMPEDASFWDEYDPIVWKKSLPTVTSPKTKRRLHQRGSGSSSELDLPERLKKSPRKKVEHTSPPWSSRPVSPSPASPKPRIPLQKKFDDVIEISSDSESDGPVPVKSKPLPPLLVARSKSASSSHEKISTISSLKASQLPKSQKLKVLDVIDL
ncbi:hypothetical protein CPC08DRAFT_707255, partial [Agrocybe pediades]